MSVRHSLLALLDAGPMHGYGLKTEFEAATGDVWPLNVGQVYRVVGIGTGQENNNGGTAYFPLAALQRLTGMGGASNALWLTTSGSSRPGDRPAGRARRRHRGHAAGHQAAAAPGHQDPGKRRAPLPVIHAMTAALLRPVARAR